MNFLYINVLFSTLHVASAIVQMFYLGKNTNELVPWIDGYILVSYSLALHCVSAFFHIFFCIFSRYIKQQHIEIKKQNPFRWLLSFITDPIYTFILLLLVGQTNFDILLLSAISSFSIAGLCHLQDESNNQFTPSIFSLPLAITITSVAFKGIVSDQNTIDPNLKNVVGVLTFTPFIKFIIQYFFLQNKTQHFVVIEHAIDEEDKEQNVNEMNDELDITMKEASRVVKYELIYYIYTFINISILSWSCVYITKMNMTFHR